MVRQRNAEWHMRRRERRLVEKQCGHKKPKWRFPNILLAMQVCARLVKEDGRPVSFYECGDCGEIHVGHLAEGESIFMYGPWAEDVRKLQLNGG